MRYFISGGYTGENGVIKKSSYKRYNFRASIETTFVSGCALMQA